MPTGETTDYSGTGCPVDIARFGTVSYWTDSDDPHQITAHDVDTGSLELIDADDAVHLGLRWERPQHVHEVHVDPADGGDLDASRWHFEYWHDSWPAHPGGHWVDIDDPFNGEWVRAHGPTETRDGELVFTFDPLDYTELRQTERVRAEESPDFPVTYRKTLQCRLVYEGNGTPSLNDVSVFSDSWWEELTLRAWVDGEVIPAESDRWDVHNGSVSPSPEYDDAVRVRYAMGAEAERYETAVSYYPDTQFDGRFADATGSPGRTIVTVLTGETTDHGIDDGVSFLPGDLAAGETVSVPAKRFRVAPVDGADETGTPSIDDGRNSRESIYDRVESEDEQTYERAAREIPHLEKTKALPKERYVPLGRESNKQEFGLLYNGDVWVSKPQQKLVSRDTRNLLWPGDELTYRVASGDPPDFQEGEDDTVQSVRDGHLPIVTTEWKDRAVSYKQTAFATYLDDEPAGIEDVRGDESTVLAATYRVRNTKQSRHTARLWFTVEPGDDIPGEDLEVADDDTVRAVARRARDDTPAARGSQDGEQHWHRHQYDEPRLRFAFDDVDADEITVQPLEGDQSALTTYAVVWERELPPEAEAEFTVAIPFETYTDDDRIDDVCALDHETEREHVRSTWEEFVDSGTGVSIPEQPLADFWESIPPHVAISVDRDASSGLDMVPAATFVYNVCANEACMQIHMMDLRSYHDRAKNYLEAFLQCQGSKGLDGDFGSPDGALTGLKVGDGVDYQSFNYNLDHGWVMWTCAEHYRLTGDADWLDEWADNLVDACEFIVRERKRTMQETADGPVPEHGLLPAGHLEDNAEWHYWYAVNAYAYRGFDAVADVLSEIDHPEAERLRAEADAYRADLRRAIDRSIRDAPVVKLRDGTWVPHVPTRSRLRGRDLGWIRENLYGAIHLLETGVLDVDSREATWILQDYEDNKFATPAFGRFVDRDEFWFSQGGISIQSGLLTNPVIYQQRGQRKHALRAFYNTLAAHLYPDVRCFTEHPVKQFGEGLGPYYKTPDEAGFGRWLRYFYVDDTQDALQLGMGVPDAWFEPGESFGIEEAPTRYGQLSWTFEVSEDGSAATLTVETDDRLGDTPIVARVPPISDVDDIEIDCEGGDIDDVNTEADAVRIESPSDEVTVTYGV